MKQLIKKQTRTLALGTSALCLMASVGNAAQVYATDVIVQGSICAGFDCSSSESFGFDTLRLKENNLRIHFDDTSSSASFPGNDWRIIANDSSNGGENYLGIEDSTAGRIPFRVEAGAPVNTLYVEADGDVGIKTANPVVDLHIVEGNTPTLRLEQDGSDGFTPQTFDVAANESNFFIRDVTNGSKLSFRIRPGAPESSIDIAADGDVGIGTSSPSAALHVRRTNGLAQLLIEETLSGFSQQIKIINNGAPRIQFEDSSTSLGTWQMGLANPSGDFLIRDDASGTNVATFSRTGNLTLTGGLITTLGGGACTVADPCDRVFDETVYTVPSIEEHAAEMWSNKYLPAVGPTNAGDAIDVSLKLTRMLNELEKAHIYIEQLHGRLAVLEETSEVIKY
ncbi:MAG: hypothetical protein ABJO67_17475 [Pseudoruegeria sp.]